MRNMTNYNIYNMLLIITRLNMIYSLKNKVIFKSTRSITNYSLFNLIKYLESSVNFVKLI
jgi:hypothetical protein